MECLTRLRFHRRWPQQQHLNRGHEELSLHVTFDQPKPWKLRLQLRQHLQLKDNHLQHHRPPQLRNWRLRCTTTTTLIRELTLELSSPLPHCYSPLFALEERFCIFTTFIRWSKIWSANGGDTCAAKWIHPNAKLLWSCPLPFLHSKNLPNFRIREIWNHQFLHVRSVELGIFVYCLWQLANHWMLPLMVSRCPETVPVQPRPARVLKKRILAPRESSITDLLFFRSRRQAIGKLFTQPLKFLSSRIYWGHVLRFSLHKSSYILPLYVHFAYHPKNLTSSSGIVSAAWTTWALKMNVDCQSFKYNV